MDRPAEGIQRFTVPLAFDEPDHLHVHVLDTPDGPLLIDTGAKGSGQALTSGIQALDAKPTRFLLTHGHTDHWGLATLLTDRVLAHQGVEKALRFQAGEASYGPQAEALRAAFGDINALAMDVPQVDQIDEGDRFGDWVVVFTPGHDAGHVCLFRESDGVLIGGDLLLPDHTPNISPDASGADALADFKRSLERVKQMPITLVLPAHGEPFTDAAGRAQELLDHHDRRLDKLRACLAEGPADLRTLRNAAFRTRAKSKADKMLAAMETYAHLDHLRNLGEVLMRDDGVWVGSN